MKNTRKHPMVYVDKFLDWYGRNIILGVSVKVGELFGFIMTWILQFTSLIVLASIFLTVIFTLCIMVRFLVDLTLHFLTGVF